MGNLVDGKIRGMRKARNRERLPTTKNCQSAPNMEEHGAPARKDGGEDKSQKNEDAVPSTQDQRQSKQKDIRNSLNIADLQSADLTTTLKTEVSENLLYTQTLNMHKDQNLKKP